MKNINILFSFFLIFIAFTMSQAQHDECVTNVLPYSPDIIQGEDSNPTLGSAPNGPTINSNEIRRIYWLHGMKGDYGSWSGASTWTTLNYGKYVSAKHLDYDKTQKDLLQAANHVYSQLDIELSKGADPVLEEELRQDYIIAHSMGGIVARQVEKLKLDNNRAKPYGGVVTFGSPHSGSHLAYLRAYEPEKISQFLKTTCHELLAGPTKKFVENNKIARIVDRVFMWSKGLDKAILGPTCDAVGTLGLTLIGTEFSAPIEHSIAPGSADLSEIANVPANDSELHTVAFFGEEFDNEDMAHRFLFSVNKDVNTYPLMGADVMDDEAIAQSNQMQEHYDYYYNYLLLVAKISPFGVKKNSLQAVIGKHGYMNQGNVYNFAYKWRDGRDWFFKLNNRWKWLIGGLEIIPDPAVKCFCDCNVEDINSGYSFDVMKPVDCQLGFSGENCEAQFPSSQQASCYYIENGNAFIFAKYKSDGLVTANSAKALPNAKYPPVRMDGSGHFQMRNDSELEKSLSALYNGDIHVYFKLGE